MEKSPTFLKALSLVWSINESFESNYDFFLPIYNTSRDIKEILKLSIAKKHPARKTKMLLPGISGKP